MPRRGEMSAKTALGKALHQLHQIFILGTKGTEVISVPKEILNMSKEELKSRRRNFGTLKHNLIPEIITLLNNHECEMYSRLQSPVLAMILEVVLQSPDNSSGQRGLYLIAASLHKSRCLNRNAKLLNERRSILGKDCILFLLSYFVDMTKPSAIRRWVGILLHQLMEGLESNRMRVEFGPEDTRRQLGALILEEDNGIIRKISGDIIKGMVTSGTHLRSLWPNSIDRDVYTKFPSPTLSMTEWNEKFCDYINGMQLERNSQKHPYGTYLATGISTLPISCLGTTDQGNIIVFVGTEGISILVSATQQHFYHTLDISIDYLATVVKQLKIVDDTDLGVDNLLELIITLNKQETNCRLDSALMHLVNIRLLLDRETANNITANILHVCPDLEYKETCTAERLSRPSRRISVSDFLHVRNDTPDSVEQDETCVRLTSLLTSGPKIPDPSFPKAVNRDPNENAKPKTRAYAAPELVDKAPVLMAEDGRHDTAMTLTRSRPKELAGKTMKSPSSLSNNKLNRRSMRSKNIDNDIWKIPATPRTGGKVTSKSNAKALITRNSKSEQNIKQKRSSAPAKLSSLSTKQSCQLKEPKTSRNSYPVGVQHNSKHSDVFMAVEGHRQGDNKPAVSGKSGDLRHETKRAGLDSEDWLGSDPDIKEAGSNNIESDLEISILSGSHTDLTNRVLTLRETERDAACNEEWASKLNGILGILTNTYHSESNKDKNEGKRTSCGSGRTKKRVTDDLRSFSSSGYWCPEAELLNPTSHSSSVLRQGKTERSARKITENPTKIEMETPESSRSVTYLHKEYSPLDNPSTVPSLKVISPKRLPRENTVCTPSTVDFWSCHPSNHDTQRSGEHATRRNGTLNRDTNQPEQSSSHKRKRSDMDMEELKTHETVDCQSVVERGCLTTTETALDMKTQTLDVHPKTNPVLCTSQRSFVDQNGSPIAKARKRVDHIEKVKRRLFHVSTKDDSGFSQYEHDKPRYEFPSIPKTKPLLPEDATARYIPHRETRNGVYETLNLQGEVGPVKRLADPFIEPQSRRTVGHLELKKRNAEVVKAINKSEAAEMLPATTFGQDLEDTDTLVASEGSTLSDLAYKTRDAESNDRRTSQSAAQDEAKKIWSAALRPHYTEYSNALHQIADEMIISLSNEEEAFDLIIMQYEENGVKLRERHRSDREAEKGKIIAAIENNKRDIRIAYGEAREFVGEVAYNLTASLTAPLEVGWKKRQDSIRQQIIRGSSLTIDHGEVESRSAMS